MNFQAKIIELAKANGYFRQVVATNGHSQVVVMSIQPGEDIGLETHGDIDQILVFVEGQAEALVGGQTSLVGSGDLVVVPANTEHNFTNTGSIPLKLYTIYAPAEHADGTIHKTRAEAMAAEEYHH